MTEILFILLDNLNEIQKKFMCFHLPVKFIKLTKNLLKQKLRYIIIKKDLKNKYLLSKYLLRWNNNIHSNKEYISPYRYIKSPKNHIHKDINEESNISKYIKEYLFYYNNNFNDNNNDEQKNRNKNYFTLNNEKRSKTYNNIIKKNNFYIKNNILKTLYDDKKNNYIKIKNNNKNKINNKKPMNDIIKIKNSNFINYKHDNINNKRIEDTTISSILKDSNETNINLISTNSYTKNNICNSKNENNSFLTQRYNPDSFIMNSYNMNTNKFKIMNNIKKEKEINDFLKKKEMYLNKKQLHNFFNENIKNNDSISPITKIYKKNFINNNLLSNSNKNNVNNINNIYMTTYSNKFNPPFCENIKQSFSKNQYSVYNRLFEDGKNRNKKQREKKLEQEKQLNDLSNQISGYKKKVDYNRINKLYENKEKNKSFEKTKKKVENEEGLTFRPFINKSEYTQRIYSNFMERNYYNNKCLNENNFISSTSSNLNTQKKLTKKQKERIINRIIDKLNTNTPIKNISRSCNKYTKEVNYNSKSHKKKL